MARFILIYLSIILLGVLTWYITFQLKISYKALKGSRLITRIRPFSLLVAFILFILAAFHSMLLDAGDLSEHSFLIISTLLLALALSFNRTYIRHFLSESKQQLFKLKIIIARYLIKFGNKR